MIKVNVKNRAEVLRALGRTNQAIVRGVAQAVLDGGAALMAEARARAPVDTGALKKSIVAEATQLKDGTPAVRVKADLFYARFVEFGTRASTRGQVMLDGTGANWAKNKKSKRKRIKGIEARTAARTHPGSRARPFLFPAYRAKKKAIQSAVAKALADAARKSA